MSHIQVILTWVCHCLIRFTSTPPCLISNSGHCAQGLFEPEWALFFFLDKQMSSRLYWKPVNIIQASSHSLSREPQRAWCSSAQHNTLLFSSLLFSSLLFSSLLFSSLLFSSLLFSSLPSNLWNGVNNVYNYLVLLFSNVEKTVYEFVVY